MWRVIVLEVRIMFHRSRALLVNGGLQVRELDESSGLTGIGGRDTKSDE